MSIKTIIAASLALATVAASAPALAAGGETFDPPRQSWSFAGPFGTFDRGQLQRGFKVYKEVCSVCHSLTRVSFRNLSALGFTEGQIKALAATYTFPSIDDKGETVDRPGRPADRFPAIFPNDEKARAANNGAVPPDFSVIAKARTYERGFPWFILDIFSTYQEQGVDYLVALLNGYEKPPKDVKLADGQHWNKYFPGHLLAMGDPLSPRLFDEAGKTTEADFFDDKTPVTRQQVAKDVAAFLMWAAEPTMEQRKRIGLQVMLFLLVMSGLLYFTKKKVWANVAH